MKRYALILAGLFSLALMTSAIAAAEDKAEDVYKAKCAKCHGADGKPTAAGTKLGAKDFADPEVAKMADAKMIEITTTGEKKMPAYGKSLDEAQIKGLVTYIRSLTKAKK